MLINEEINLKTEKVINCSDFPDCPLFVAFNKNLTKDGAKQNMSSMAKRHVLP